MIGDIDKDDIESTEEESTEDVESSEEGTEESVEKDKDEDTGS